MLRFFLIWIGFFISFVSLADGVLIPDVPLLHKYQLLTMESHTVEINIESNIAKVTVVEEFKNPTNKTIQAYYYFAVPENAFLTSFSMFVGKKRYKAKLLSKEKAREIYNNLLKKMLDPAILEFYNSSLYMVKVAPIRPHKSRVIKITYNQLLKPIIFNEFLNYEFTYPLKIDKYVREFKNFNLKITLKTKRPILDLKVKGFENVDIRKINDKEFLIKVNRRFLNKIDDLKIQFKEAIKKEDIYLNFTAEKYKKSTFFKLDILPNLNVKRLNREIVFVLDNSGSMSEGKLEAAIEALKWFVSRLNSNERFNVVVFNTWIDKFSDKTVFATLSEKKKLKNYLDALFAAGGTNIYEALKAGVNSFSTDETKLKIMVFITDGMPTIGNTNINQIIDYVNSNAKFQNIVLFLVGIGEDVNTILLNQLAKVTTGDVYYIKQDKEVISEKLMEIFNSLSYPALRNVKLQLVDATDYYPHIVKVLFNKRQISIVGKLKFQNMGFQVKLKGYISNKEVNKIFTVLYNNIKIKEGEKIAKLWASRVISYLIDKWRLTEDKDLRKEIIKLSQQFGIPTIFTSYLITDQTTPEVAEHVRRKLNNVIEESLRISGKNSIALSKSLASNIKTGKNVNLLNFSDFKTVYNAGKLFLRDVNSRYYEVKPKRLDSKFLKVKFLSPAYFYLLKVYPQVAKYFRFGYVTFEYNGLVICVDKDGVEDIKKVQIVLGIKKKK